eukprot:5196382-Pyramimonas_sp.AAC.1
MNSHSSVLATAQGRTGCTRCAWARPRTLEPKQVRPRPLRHESPMGEAYHGWVPIVFARPRAVRMAVVAGDAAPAFSQQGPQGGQGDRLRWAAYSQTR